MSFSARVKAELHQSISDKRCCKQAETAAQLRVAGMISFAEENQVRVKLHHTLTLRSKKDPLFAQSGIVFGEKEPIFEQYLVDQKRCCKKEYVRGAFLAGGSVSDPDKEYHLEIVCWDGMIAEELAEYLETFAIAAKVVDRKGHAVLYIKEAEQIIDFLSLIGAHQSMMEFENVRILKEVRNNVNRQVNCETANIQKTVDASLRQVHHIQQLMQEGGLEKLSPQLRETAILRVENPDLSLLELGQLHEKPIGKSGINHRLRKIDEIVEGGTLRG